LDPHLFIGTLDFRIGLQTSRPRFDEGRMLGAAKVQSGDPPAIRAGHKWARTAKAGFWGVAFDTPLSFYYKKLFFLINFCKKQ